MNVRPVMKYWLGLGSNIGDGPANIKEALERISAVPGIRVLRSSCIYLTEPWGEPDQPDFANAVAEVESDFQAIDLLQRLQAIETDMGRVPAARRWGPRLIDLDLLLAGQDIVSLPDLSVPHPRMHLRAFVLVPLAEFGADRVIPGHGTVADCLGRLPEKERERVSAGNL